MHSRGVWTSAPLLATQPGKVRRQNSPNAYLNDKVYTIPAAGVDDAASAPLLDVDEANSVIRTYARRPVTER